MTESITIRFEISESGKQEVGIVYYPATIEAMPGDELRASELAVHALMQHVIALREHTAKSIPAVMVDFVEAHTYKEVL